MPAPVTGGDTVVDVGFCVVLVVDAVVLLVVDAGDVDEVEGGGVVEEDDGTVVWAFALELNASGTAKATTATNAAAPDVMSRSRQGALP